MTAGWLTLIGIYGALAGSYLGVVLDRIPAHQPMTGQSQCASCGTAVRWSDNWPVASYVRLRGRCRDCQTPIPRSLWLLELGVLATWVGAAALGEADAQTIVVLSGLWFAIAVGSLLLSSTSTSSVLRSVGLDTWLRVVLPVPALAGLPVALGMAMQQRWQPAAMTAALSAAALLTAVAVAPGAHTGRQAVERAL